MNLNKIAIGAGAVITALLIFKFMGFLFKYAIIILIGGLVYALYQNRSGKA